VTPDKAGNPVASCACDGLKEPGPLLSTEAAAALVLSCTGGSKVEWGEYGCTCGYDGAFKAVVK